MGRIVGIDLGTTNSLVGYTDSQTGQPKCIPGPYGSTLCPSVVSLDADGSIIVGEAARNRLLTQPERTIYSLTPLGRSELHDWMRELLARPQSEFPRFGVALSLLAVLTPAESAALLTQRLAALDAEIGEIEDTMRGAEDRGVAWIFLIEEEYRKDLVRAERDFVERLIESLNRPDYVQAWQEMFEGNV